LYTAPPQGQGVHPVQYFEFALQVTNPNGALTATFTPGAPLAALSGFSPVSGTGDAPGLQTFTWSSIGVPTYAKTYDFPATEIVLGTVAFSGPISGAIVNAIDYQNATPYGGKATEQAIWAMYVDPSGIDVNNYDHLFYQSKPSAGADGTPGSLPPAQVSGQGASNQTLSLTPTPLPLKLLAFTATAQSGKTNTALLNWTAAEQVNTSRFEIERSTNGKIYTAIGTVQAAGNYAGKMDYTFTDANAQNGTNYYRLKMVDIDCQSTYSPVKTVLFGDAASVNVYIAPNPTRGQFYVKGLTASSIVNVIDMSGKVLQTYSGVNQYSMVNISHLPSGVYLVQVIEEGKFVGTFKVVKE